MGRMPNGRTFLTDLQRARYNTKEEAEAKALELTETYGSVYTVVPSTTAKQRRRTRVKYAKATVTKPRICALCGLHIAQEDTGRHVAMIIPSESKDNTPTEVIAICKECAK